jgi:hypothetical protein
VTPAHVRELALALPEAVEQDHHGSPSFRVGGRIFATLPDDTTLRVMLDVDAVEEAVAAAPEQCSVLRWGAKVSGVAVRLAAADPETVGDLLADAWRRRAPVRLRRSFGET